MGSGWMLDCWNMVFTPRDKENIVSYSFPEFILNGHPLKYVSKFCYLGHVITNTLSDENNIHREIRNMYIRANMLFRKFNKCSIRVFRSYCICLYGIALLKKYTKTCLDKFKMCYHRCIRLFFGYSTMHNVTEILFELGLPSFNTLVHNSRVTYRTQIANSTNDILMHLDC